jgi:hypothetical protein
MKPLPLFIPSDINNFQQQQQNRMNQSHQQGGVPFYGHSSSFNGTTSASMNNSYNNPYGYPNATLLKSPRLLNYDLKKQYTPPPMLSPFRKGPGLFYNSKQIASILYAANNPLLSHSLSYSYPSTTSSFAHLTSLIQQQQQQQLLQQQNQRNSDSSRHELHHQSESFHDEYRPEQQEHDDHYNQDQDVENGKIVSIAKKQKISKLPCYDEEEEKQPARAIIEKEKPSNSDSSVIAITLTSKSSSVSDETNEDVAVTKSSQQVTCVQTTTTTTVELSASSSSAVLKPSLMRSRLLSQISSSSGGCAFFPDESANEAITAALIDCAEINTKPFVNLGEDYQADLPELRGNL